MPVIMSRELTDGFQSFPKKQSQVATSLVLWLGNRIYRPIINEGREMDLLLTGVSQRVISVQLPEKLVRNRTVV